MVLLTVTPAISAALEKYFESSKTPVLDHSSLEDYSSAISHNDLILLAKHTSVSLSQLTRGTQVYFPPKKAPPPKSKEYMKLMEKLRAQQQEKEYQELLGNRYNDEPDITPGKAVKELREQLSTIVNIAVSVGSVAFAIWYWTGTSTHWSMSARTLLSLFAAILVLVAETVVYLGYKNKIAEAQAVEKAKKEIKEVVSSTPVVPVTKIKEHPPSSARKKNLVKRKL